MSLEWLVRLAPFLLLLACPITMWFMMRGMSSGDHCRGSSENRSEAPEGALLREVEALRARVAELEAGSGASHGWRPNATLRRQPSLK